MWRRSCAFLYTFACIFHRKLGRGRKYEGITGNYKNSVVFFPVLGCVQKELILVRGNIAPLPPPPPPHPRQPYHSLSPRLCRCHCCCHCHCHCRCYRLCVSLAGFVIISCGVVGCNTVRGNQSQWESSTSKSETGSRPRFLDVRFFPCRVCPRHTRDSCRVGRRVYPVSIADTCFFLSLFLFGLGFLLSSLGWSGMKGDGGAIDATRTSLSKYFSTRKGSLESARDANPFAATPERC